MQLSWTFSRYLGRQFLSGMAIVMGGCMFLIFMVDTVELLRRSASKPDVGLNLVFTMALLKLPNVSETALPFAVLFGAIWTFVRLTRSNELVIARASGVSVWQFIAPALAIALIGGTILVTVYNPIASTMVARYEQLESRYLRGYTSLLAVKSTGFWLRQGSGNNQSIIHAETVAHVSDETLSLENVLVFQYKNQDDYVSRIDAQSADLHNGYWLLKGAVRSLSGAAPEPLGEYKLPTEMDPDQIRESFASPETLSFWDLPRFISITEAAGFSALPHRLHWQTLLATPLLLAAMVLIAATFSLRITRLGGVPQLAAAGIMTGFLLYFLADVSGALGISGIIPVALAAWAPTLIATFLGTAMLFHLEDG